MEKKNILYLFLIVLFGVIFRIWNMTPLSVNQDIALNLNGSFFHVLFSNGIAPFYPLITKLFSIPYLNVINPYLSILFDISSIIVLYYAGCEFNDKKNEILTGLLSAGFSCISVFLIHLAKNNSIYSLVFLLSSIIILYSLKVINTQNKKYLVPIFVSDILLILTFNLGVFFVIFNILAIMSFYAKKRKNFEAYFITFFGLFLLISPLIPFVLNIIDVPDYIAQYSLPFHSKDILVYLTNMFSPKLSLGEYLDFSNLGFWIFVILTSVLGLFLSIKGVLHKRNSCYFMISLFISTFLSMLIICICLNKTLLSEYLITIYPILIVTFANGTPSLKSKTLKIVPVTIFATITIFYIIAKHFISANLF